MATMASPASAPNILWLADPACGDRTTCGGKAAHLSRLSAAYRVPSGFCLTTMAFDRVLAAGSAGRPVLPEDLVEDLARAYHELGEHCGTAPPSVAVRSSAVDEDAVDASFAGQYETYLNVTGVDMVAEAVARCWASAEEPRVQEYRRWHGLPPEGVRLAVLIQHMIVADASAVVFSVNPVTGNRDEVVITASWGLGESVVGGTVTPDTYVVRKVDLTVTACSIADKQRMIVPAAGGTAERAVPGFLRRRRCLDDAQLTEMARLSMALEEAMGWPVDVECALRAGHLYLLQCRPITTVGRDYLRSRST